MKSAIIAMCVAALAGGVLAAPPGPAAGPGELGPTEHGFRMTPEIARGMGWQAAEEIFNDQYKLPQEKIDQAAELIARRLMDTAHRLDGQGQEFVERALEEVMRQELSRDRRGVGAIPQGFGREFGQRTVPMLPAVRDLVRDVANDVRPMLPMQEQLRLARDMMAFKTAMDAFEQTMGDWASGKVTTYSDPFNQTEHHEIKLDEQGRSAELNGVRQSAEMMARTDRWVNEWEAYLKEFKQFYGLDDSQCATADSILREFKAAAERLTADQRSNARSGELALICQQMLFSMPEGWNHPVRVLLQDRIDAGTREWARLGTEFRLRLEPVPTDSQRRASTERVEAMLKEKGFEP